jgi:phosphatidyl-myo-inositol alpha-mannosyltransferase
VRIAIVSPYDLSIPGGVQQHVMHLAVALRDGGDEVVVVGPGADQVGGRSVGGSIRVPFNDSVAPIALDPRTWARTRRVLADIDPDVVHVHEPFVPLVSTAAVLTSPAPVVATFHAWSDRARAYAVAGQTAGRLVARRIDAHLAVSPAAAQYHGRALGRSPRSFRVVPNGVSVARFRDAVALEDIAHPNLLFVGRLEPRKGLDQLLHAFTKLAPTHPDLHLYVVGDGPDRQRCERILPSRLREAVTFLGRVDNDDLPRWYRSADLFVAPALGGESFGIVLIEAQAAGCVVVASDIPGYASVITDGVDGRLVPPRDPSALAQAIDALLGNDTMRTALAAAGQSGVDRYDWSAVAAEVRQVYARVVGAGDIDK